MTQAWFLAAARIIAGPPMSMFSMQSSKSAPARDRRLERIEVDHQEVDRRDAVLGQRRRDARSSRTREQTAMHLRMQRLHPAVHHLGKAGDLGDVGHREPGLGKALARAAGRDDLDAVPAQRAGESTRPVLSETEISARAILRVVMRSGCGGRGFVGIDQMSAAAAFGHALDVPDDAHFARLAHHAAEHDLRGGLRPARVGEEEALLDLGLRRVGADLPGSRRSSA